MSSEEPGRPAHARTSRLAALFTAAALGLVAASAAYVAAPGFAAGVNAIAANAAGLAGGIAHR